ncbi:MAG: hypothetical protein ACREM8_04585 [Vulcanimicrobiaceae bacterium]
MKKKLSTMDSIKLRAVQYSYDEHLSINNDPGARRYSPNHSLGLFGLSPIGERSMSRELIHVLTFVSALGAGLVAGVLFAFSSFVMTGLSRIPPA